MLPPSAQPIESLDHLASPKALRQGHLTQVAQVPTCCSGSQHSSLAPNSTSSSTHPDGQIHLDVAFNKLRDILHFTYKDWLRWILRGLKEWQSCNTQAKHFGLRLINLRWLITFMLHLQFLLDLASSCKAERYPKASVSPEEFRVFPQHD